MDSLYCIAFSMSSAAQGLSTDSVMMTPQYSNSRFWGYTPSHGILGRKRLLNFASPQDGRRRLNLLCKRALGRLRCFCSGRLRTVPALNM
ncbi:hypothetical protein AcV7_005686 [Taiwanofungus camphoratus]|nr:hypothetical protein AcV7_005686 [Antrodia cinnamomea]